MGAVAHIDEYKKGTFYSEEFRGAMSWNGYETNNLLRNEGLGEDGVPRYVDVAMALGADQGLDARGLAIADFDNDGDLDLAINNNPGDSGDVRRARPTLLRNDIGARRNWLTVDLEGTTSNRSGIGARVVLEVAGQRQAQVVAAGSSYASQHHRRLSFGLGDHPGGDRLTVYWPSGAVESFTDLPARHRLHIVEGQGVTLTDASGGGEAVEPTANGRAGAPETP